MAWGGAEEQEEERRNGNIEAKNWQDEAQKILEETVCPTLPGFFLADSVVLDGTILEGPPNHSTNGRPQ
jgi:hypothetical protein